MTTMTPVLSAVAHPVETAARHVRVTVAVVALSLFVAVVALVTFDHAPGLRASATPEAAWSAPVGEVVAAQESAGFVCSAAPVRSDRVVLERTSGSVVVLSLVSALDVTSRGDGAVRAFCR